MKKFALLAIVLIIFAPALRAEETKYTNSSFARLTYASEKIYLQRAADLGYEEAVVNTPITEGDRLGTTEGRAEIFLAKTNYVRLDENTKIDFLNLPKRGYDLVRIRIWTGNVYLDVGFLEKEKNIEIHTSDASFYVLDKGLYRINVKENTETEIFVFNGLVEVACEEGSTLLKSEQRLRVSEGRYTSSPGRFYAVAEDSFDRWSEERNSQVTRRLARRYLPEELEDFEYELDEYGDWIYLRPYGYVWVPGGVGPDWRPYYYGRWDWLPLSSWTWLPYDPWGWCTFHYGRWHWGIGLGWYWIPTTIWGPGWVSWYWGYDYFGWAPLSYWGYPGVIIDNRFYDRYYGRYYPYNSRALTVIRKDQLKARDVSRVALSQESMKNLGNITLSSRKLSLRPEAGKVRIESLGSNKVILRKADRPVELKQQEPIRESSIRSPESSDSKRMGEKSTEKPKAPEERRIRKKDDSSEPRSNEVRSSLKRNSYGYPSSPEISAKRLSRERRSLESGSFINRVHKYISRGSSSSRSSSSRGSISRGTSSRPSARISPSSSRGSSSSSRSSSRSGSVRKKN